MKTILQKIGMLMAVLLGSLSAYSYDFEVDGIYYDLNVSAKTAIVTYKDLFKESYKGDIAIPSVVNFLGNDIPVTAIGRCAFYGCKAMMSITLPQSIICIDGQAFQGCSGLKSIEFPDSLRRIGSSAFDECSSLQSVRIPGKINNLENYVFAGCSSLEEVYLPNELEVLPIGLFSGCISLKAITMPEKLRNIQNSVFFGCKALEEITFNDVLEEIGYSAFVGCSGIESIAIPNSVSTLGSSAFENCINLREITLPENLESIEIELFNGCSSLVSLNIPKKVRSIGKRAFSGCKSLLELSIPASVEEIDEDGMYGTYFTSFIFEDSPNSIYIPNYRQDVSTGNNSGYIHYVKCQFPSTITDLYIGRNISCIGGIGGKKEHDPFYNCVNLKTISVGRSVTDLSVLNTTRYGDLDSLKLACSEPPAIYPFSSNQYLKIKVFVPYETIEAYQQADVWKNFWNLEGFEYSGIDAEMISMNIQEAELNIGETVQLEATVMPEDTTDKTLEWKSSNEEVAIVDAYGLVTAISEGSAIITATCGEASAQCEITVIEESGVESIFANPDSSISIYSVDGVIIKKDAKVEDLKTLVKGIYIIVSGKDRYKISI